MSRKDSNFQHIRKLASHCDEYFGDRVTSGDSVDGVPTDYSTHDRSHWLKIHLHHLVTENDRLTKDLACNVLKELEELTLPEGKLQAKKVIEATGMPILREEAHFEADIQALSEALSEFAINPER